MMDTFDCAYVTLHVRVSNQAAFHLYNDTLGYECALDACALCHLAIPASCHLGRCHKRLSTQGAKLSLPRAVCNLQAGRGLGNDMHYHKQGAHPCLCACMHMQSAQRF